MIYLLPVLALATLLGWLYLESSSAPRSVRVPAGLLAIAAVFAAGYQIGGFATFNHYRLYPPAFLRVSEQLQAGRSAAVQTAIDEVFGKGKRAEEVHSEELMQALERAELKKATR